jgi:hypothetical protein
MLNFGLIPIAEQELDSQCRSSSDLAITLAANLWSRERNKIFDTKQSSSMAGNNDIGQCLSRVNGIVWFGSPQRAVKECGESIWTYNLPASGVESTVDVVILAVNPIIENNEESVIIVVVTVNRMHHLAEPNCRAYLILHGAPSS